MAERRVFQIGLAAALGIGLLVRLGVMASPLGEIDADEAVVGLMARHIAFLGERPVFYWGQAYLGSLEAFSVAPFFRLFDSSAPLLKLIPTAYSLGFVVISAILARRLFGTGPALATAAYLALPPVMWAVWSTKARGGYAEVVFLGQALLLTSLAFAQNRGQRLAFLWGLLAGLAVWTHLLAVVYVLPAVVFLALARRANWASAELGLAIAGGLLGSLPLVIQNVLDGFPTLAALLQPSELPIDPAAQFLRFFRVGVPVLVGLGQPTTSELLFDLDWLNRPAGQLWVVFLTLLLLAAVLWMYLSSLARLVTRGADRTVEPALLVLLVAAVPPVVAVSRFGFFVSEPRYALPLYGAVPLLAGALWQVSARVPRADALRWTIVGLVLAFNVWGVLTTSPRLWRPEDLPDSTAATRGELVHYLVGQDRHQMYTDYWIGYPVMFDTREAVLAYMISGGYNRYLPPADNVKRTPNPAWVFSPGSEAETTFLEQLATHGGRAEVADVSVYRVYTNVEPLAALRP